MGWGLMRGCQLGQTERGCSLAPSVAVARPAAGRPRRGEALSRLAKPPDSPPVHAFRTGGESGLVLTEYPGVVACRLDGQRRRKGRPPSRARAWAVGRGLSGGADKESVVCEMGWVVAAVALSAPNYSERSGPAWPVGWKP